MNKKQKKSPSPNRFSKYYQGKNYSVPNSMNDKAEGRTK